MPAMSVLAGWGILAAIFSFLGFLAVWPISRSLKRFLPEQRRLRWTVLALASLAAGALWWFLVPVAVHILFSHRAH